MPHLGTNRCFVNQERIKLIMVLSNGADLWQRKTITSHSEVIVFLCSYKRDFYLNEQTTAYKPTMQAFGAIWGGVLCFS
ncbi:MAG TPA: hypothetical protein DCM62_05530 [Bacteroidales bacterium]|nr:hypothetical protein [Bacteroidales bacterium]